MKKSFLVLSVLLITGCGVSNFNHSNIGESRTNVHLDNANFIDIRQVTGKATSTYILGIGGLSAKVATETAIADMFKNAELTDSQTIVNIHVNTHIGTVLGIFTRITHTATGQIIQFVEDGEYDNVVQSVQQTVSKLNIGDYYNENGYNGIIFEVSADGTHGKILKTLGNSANWNMALAHCKVIGTSWRLPTPDEARHFFENKQIINTSCKLHEMETLPVYVWTSSLFNENEAIYCDRHGQIEHMGTRYDLSVVAVCEF